MVNLLTSIIIVLKLR